MAKKAEKEPYNMPRKLFANAGMTPEAVAKTLTDNAVSNYESEVKVNYEEEEIEEFKEDSVKLAIEIQSLEVEKSALVKKLSGQIKEKKEKHEKLLKSIKEGSSYERMRLYGFGKMDEKMMGFYDIEGNLRVQRPMEGGEKQAKIDSDVIFADMTMHWKD